MTYIPRNIDDAIDWLVANIGGLEQALHHEDEADFIYGSEKAYSDWMRREWGFESEDSPLYFWFLSLGIKHPDDMCKIIITSTHRSYNNKNINLDAQVKDCIDFWRLGGEMWPKEPGT